MSHWPKIRPTIDAMVNQQFDTPEFKKLFAVTLTPKRVASLSKSYDILCQQPARLLGVCRRQGAARCQTRDLGA